MERTSTVGIPSVITSPRVAGIWSALLAWGVLALTAGVGAAEWPTYRADSARSGFTAENLPADLSLRWTCAPRHAPQPAWSGRDTRMPFDRAFHAVIAGDSLFFGSSVDGKVYALDAATGAERWTFFTGGPVRLSPTVWRERVFAVSDDGFLYCLAARDGKVVWKRRGGPSGSLALGNGRMISRWPARGGPVVADGVVYWAAGIWPSEGVFIYAQDALTGKVLWCNDTAGGLFMPQPHPGSVSYSGVSAQGHLLVVGDKLLVPTGRAVPAVFSRADGKLLYFHLQPFGKAGGASVAATDAQFFNGGLAFDLATGKQAFKAGADPLAMAVTPQAIVCATAKEIVAVDRGNLWRRQEVTDATGKATTQTVFAEPVWRAPNPHAPTSSLVVAGDKAVVGRAGRVSVLDMGSQTVLFSAAVEGEPLGLAVAGGRLYVSTDKGVIHCFGGGRRASPK
ncbi:MAG: PQQ-like beta-propeller repeat protein, partial [Planctomycetes bacterium]|nr:PQQ-like beta-propeller repeat protein [Planctomycetota bacterium]